MTITQERLKELLHYDPETGVFTWKVGTVKTRAGDIAGSKTKKGYVQITVDRKNRLAHRLAFIYMTGSAPTMVDHRDLNKSNNIFRNLRAATHSQNQANHPRSSKNTSGFKGVNFDRYNNSWRAQVNFGSICRKKVGFLTPEDAHRWYCEMASEIHGEFARVA